MLRKQPIEDGAWLLLRLRRSHEYTGYRPWQENARALRLDLGELLQDAGQTTSKADALKQLQPSSSGSQTVFDKFVQLRGLIKADGVISERQATTQIALLYKAINDCRISVKTDQPATFGIALAETSRTLLAGEPIPTEFRNLLRHQAADVIASRPSMHPVLNASRMPDSELLALSVDKLYQLPQTLSFLA